MYLWPDYYLPLQLILVGHEQPVRSGPSTANGLKPANTSMNFGAIQNLFEIRQPIIVTERGTDEGKHIIT